MQELQLYICISQVIPKTLLVPFFSGHGVYMNTVTTRSHPEMVGDRYVKCDLNCDLYRQWSNYNAVPPGGSVCHSWVSVLLGSIFVGSICCITNRSNGVWALMWQWPKTVTLMYCMH